MTYENESKTAVRVWDLPTRLFHWSLVAFVAASFVTGNFGPMSLHQTLGLGALTLVLFRLVWGFVGGTHARFIDFVKGPRAALDYLIATRQGHPPLMVGHNPLGGLMVLALLAVLPLQVALGLFSNDDIAYDAPLSKFVTKASSDLATGLHSGLSNILLFLIGLHVGAAFFYLLVKKDNLIRPMVTGWKLLPASFAKHPAKMGHPLLAAIILAVCGGAVWGLLFL